MERFFRDLTDKRLPVASSAMWTPSLRPPRVEHEHLAEVIEETAAADSLFIDHPKRGAGIKKAVPLFGSTANGFDFREA